MAIDKLAIKALQFGWRRRMPVVLQTEATECGLACLVMISRYFGHDVDLPSLRQRFSTSLNGVSLERVMEIAARLNLRTRAVQLETGSLKQLRTPCILHWDLNHFVVLKSASARRVVIHDPMRGMYTLAMGEASKHFAGIALELQPGPEFEPVRSKQRLSLRALAGNVHGLGAALTLIFLLAMGLEAFSLTGPLYLQWILDQVLASEDKNLLMLLGIGFATLTIFQTAITALRAWMVTWLSATLSVQWVSNLFSHLLHLPLDWYEKRHIGDVVSRFGSIQSIEKTLTTNFVTAILDGLMAVFTILIMYLYSVQLTLLVLSAFTVYSILRWVAFRPLRRAQEEQIIFAARQQSELLEAIRGAQTLKLHNQQAVRSSRYANAIVETTNRDIAMQRLNIGFSAGNQLIFGLERIALIWLAAQMVLNGDFTAGMLVAFSSYAEQFTSRASSLINKGFEFRMLGLHTERVADIALTPPETHLESGYAGPLPDTSIEFRNVSFRYSEGEPWILKDCSMRIPAGEMVAIVGPSGCGKTTLVKILLGLLELKEGEVLCGGIDIRKLGLARYRSQVGAVLQDDRVFAGSVADNIAFSDPNATWLRIEDAARTASIHDDIVAMPMGYQTLVGDMGSSLSGGQKQRLILARALYRRPQILVLDEATSHLDIERERQINAAVNRLAITRIVVAHSPETISSAERVMAMTNGSLQLVQPRPREGVVSHLS
ncbi:MAG: ABC transporter [Rhodanobacter sp. SCN 67-45]|nr:MAG: ABC transporter [Rhodanobacter sp. SCN 67-45]